MTHCYQFNLWPPLPGLGIESGNRVRTEVVISYNSRDVQDNHSLQIVARSLLTQLISDWLIGDGSEINSYVSPMVLSNYLRSDNYPTLADWVLSFEEISVYNLDEQPGSCIWIVLS